MQKAYSIAFGKSRMQLIWIGNIACVGFRSHETITGFFETMRCFLCFWYCIVNHNTGYSSEIKGISIMAGIGTGEIAAGRVYEVCHCSCSCPSLQYLWLSTFREKKFLLVLAIILLPTSIGNCKQSETEHCFGLFEFYYCTFSRGNAWSSVFLIGVLGFGISYWV
jgi:hypothetical protein